MTTPLNDWIKQFPRHEVEQRVRQLESELARWQQVLAMHDSIVGDNLAAPSSPVPTKPQAIATILQHADRALKPGEIMAQMVARGWLPSHTSAKKRFYSTMSRLTAEKRITRLPDGRYVLPSHNQEALPDDY